MMKILRFLIGTALILVFGLLLLAYLVKRPAFTGNIEDHSLLQINPEDLEAHVKTLSESFLPRNCYHPENLRLAAEYIKTYFSGLNPDTSYQAYKIDDKEFVNVISNFGPDTSEIIVLGAHYDAYSSHPGADDNASGVAGLLEIARLLSLDPPEKRVVLVAYACEEPPYFASESMGSYVHASSIKSKQVRLMVSIEMIGYYSDAKGSQSFPIPYLAYLYPDTGNYIAVVGELFSNEAKNLKKSINYFTDIEAYSINAPHIVPGIDYSDHRNYWAFDFPAVMVTDTAFYRNDKYHTPEDTFDRLDYKKMAMVVYGIFKHVQTL